MVEIKSENFFENEHELDGVFVFYSKYCGMCVKAFEEIENYGIDDWYSVCCDDDYDAFISILVDDMPTTRLYKEGEVIIEKKGVLYPKQIKDILSYL